MTQGQLDKRLTRLASEVVKLNAMNAELRMALEWAMRRIREPMLVRGQNDEHFAAYQRAADAIANARGAA